MSTTPQAVPQGVPFSFFVSLLREISLHSRPRKAGVKRDKHIAYPALAIFGKWIARLRSEFAPLPEGTTATVFRLLFPEEDARRKYDMKETRLASTLADCFGVSAEPLRKWGTDGSSGCLGDQVLKIMNKSSSYAADYISPFSIADIDRLLDELASHSGYSHTSVRTKHPHATRRKSSMVIRTLFRSLAPLDAAFLTQIILKDLRPLLYPLTDTHYTVALKSFNSVAITQLSKEDAMKAWDPSRQMLGIYRVRSGLDDASFAFEAGITDADMPRMATPVEIPKSEKGRGCLHALEILRHSQEIWAETKYDGERTQIHVEILADNRSRITIFSKSKRDSTWDRHAIHSVIREALGLPQESDTVRSASFSSPVKTNIILDAEMVAWHGEKIDEYWRIRTLIENTAHSARAVDRPTVAIEAYSQASLMTDFSDDRHLGLVFFDILLLNSTSLLSVPYSSRRSILESIIKPIANRAILADRKPIALNFNTNENKESLHRVFGECLAYAEEGLVLKAGEAGYNDRRFPWVKLKKDYIPGYGDCVDLLVLGASWEKERGRELRVAPNTYTTFYLGGLHNAEELERNPSSRPHFHIYFTAAYGLSREQLEELNFLLKSSDYTPYNPSAPPSALPYTYSMLPGLVPPTMLLHEPLLGELFGAGFTKSPRSRHYELRFPRLTKIFRASERSWRDAINLQNLHKVARDVVGRERSYKDIDDWNNRLWGKSVSPGVTGTLKRKAKADEWEERLLASDRKLARKRGWTAFDSRVLRSQPTSNVVRSLPRPLGSRTNLGTSRSPSSPVAHRAQPIRPSIEPIKLLISADLAAVSTLPSSPTTPRTSPSRPVKLRQSTLYPSPVRSPFIAQPTRIRIPPAKQESITDVLANSIVFVAAQNDISRRRWKAVIPPERIVHSLESLFVACGWEPEDSQPPSASLQRGIIILDNAEESGPHRVRTLNALNARKVLCDDLSDRKAIWVLERSPDEI
ncbi:hypothetical protein C8R43DRAFT_1134885 [Mycena crocata]|nr:hypothetical protein C8R43DRAFT_1134885 [Mycena crocata]